MFSISILTTFTEIDRNNLVTFKFFNKKHEHLIIYKPAIQKKKIIKNPINKMKTNTKCIFLLFD